MPWNDESGGNGSGNGGGRGPWGQGPSGGGQGGGSGPDLEDLLRRGQERFRRAAGRGGRGGGGGGGGFGGLGASGAFLAIALVLGAWIFTGVFQVNPGEVGVITRFGAYDREVGTGLHLHLPFPIESRYVPNVQEVRRVNIGFHEEGERARGSRAADALMLTGDENIIRIDFTVLWNINDARAYLFNIRDQEGAVRAAAESALREVAGQNELQTLLTLDRAAVAERVESLLQAMLDDYAAGVNIVAVNLQNVLPPDQVQDAFDEVQSAEQNEVRLQNQANQYAAQIVEEAGGQVEAIIQQAEGYREQTIAQAEGEAARFVSVYDEYANAPDVTRERMYLETMERVFGDMDKIILDEGGGGVVPYLPLNELQPSGTRPASN